MKNTAPKHQPMTPSTAGKRSERPSPRTYAEALTGSPHTGSPRDCLSNDVDFDNTNTKDNLSSLMDKAMDETTVVSEIITKIPNRTSLPINTKGPSTSDESTINTLSTRKRWTKEDNKELFTCYCEALKLGLNQTKGTYEIWRKKFPNDRPNMDPTKLANQRRYAEKKVLT